MTSTGESWRGGDDPDDGDAGCDWLRPDWFAMPTAPSCGSSRKKMPTLQERAVREVNTGIIACRRQLWEKLAAITCDVPPRENTILTDVIALLVAAGETVAAVAAEDPAETLGVNSRAQLAEVKRSCADARWRNCWRPA